MTPLTWVAAALALHALAILCAYAAATTRTDLTCAALILSAILASMNAYLATFLNL